MSDTRVPYKPYIVGGASTSFVVSAASAPTPSTIFGSSLLAWYKADPVSGLTKSGGGPPSNGDIVVGMVDYSANAYNLSTFAGTPYAGTTYQSASAIAGLPAVNFVNSGTSDAHLQTTANAVSLGGNVLSIFYVCQLATVHLTNARLFAFLGNGDNNEVTDASSWAGMLSDAALSQITDYRNNTQESTQAISLATTSHLGMVYDGANTIVTPYLNGVAGTPFNSAPATAFNATGTIGICTQWISGVGAGPFLLNGWSGPIAEMVFVKAVATAPQIASLEAYFVGRGF